MRMFAITTLLSIALYILFSFFYHKFCVFSVLPGDEAIVTQSGAILGQPRKSGFHRINPFTQKVHNFQMERLRKWTANIDKCDMDFIIYWRINDSLKFYKKFSKINMDEYLNCLFTNVKNYIENGFDSSGTNKSLKTEGKFNCQPTDFDDVIEVFQDEISPLGVRMVRIALMPTEKKISEGVGPR